MGGNPNDWLKPDNLRFQLILLDRPYPAGDIGAGPAVWSLERSEM